MVNASNSTVAHQADEVFERFEIEFDAGQDPVFHGGELITGCLKVNLKKQITINAVRIQFKGRACWLAHDTKEGLEQEKVYFDKDFVLLERPPGRPEPGHFPWNANFTYSLPFECPLPKGCPTSYESPQAFVRYYARATFQTDEVEPTQYLVKKAFSIIAPPDLHDLLPPQSDPATKTEVVSFGGCCCRGKFTAEVTLPKSAYAPGENVFGNFTVNNRHPKHFIDQMEVRLVDKVKRADAQEASSTTRPVTNHRVLHYRKLNKEDVVNTKSSLSANNVFFLSIPAVHTSTTSIKDNEPFSPELIVSLAPGDQVSKLLESPSTATLKQRKQPFIRVEYALQVSLGASVLIEVPITIHPIPIYANGIAFRPFAAGAQPIAESDEADKKLFHGPFSFAPQYPIYLEPPKPTDGMVSRQVTHETNAVPNGVAELTKTVEISELPDGSKIVHTKEEYVVASQYSTTTTTTQQQHTSNQPDGEEVPNEVKVQVETIHHNEFVPAPVEQAQPSNFTEVEQPSSNHIIDEEAEKIIENNEPEDTDNTIIYSDGVMSNGHQNGDEHVVEHHETDEQLANGHLHTTTETIEDGPDSKTQRVIEDLEYEDENGVKVHVQKTTESTQILSNTTTEIVAE